jgi:CRP/FNR family transcriptional regulator, cyclic AMP receptor protein
MRKALIILGTLDDSDIDWMIASGKRQRVPARTTLITEGQTIDYVYIVVDGAFAVQVAALQGKEIAQLRAGEIVGELSFVDARPASASVVALEDSLVLSIPSASLKERLKDPTFSARFYRSLAVFLANRLRNTVTHLGFGRAADDEVDMGDEIGPTMLETLSVAGARLNWMMKRLRGD